MWKNIALLCRRRYTQHATRRTPPEPPLTTNYTRHFILISAKHVSHAANLYTNHFLQFISLFKSYAFVLIRCINCIGYITFGDRANRKYEMLLHGEKQHGEKQKEKIKKKKEDTTLRKEKRGREKFKCAIDREQNGGFSILIKTDRHTERQTGGPAVSQKQSDS